MSNDSRNSIRNTGEHHPKRTRLSEKNTINEFVEENTNSFCCSVEEETIESENECDWLESSDFVSNSDSGFEL